MRKPAMKSRRLTYRRLEAADAVAVAALAGDWDVASMTARIPFPYTPAAAAEWIASLSEREFVRGIVHDGRLIGAVGYFPVADGSAEIGYWIGKPWWGHGYATEAAEALVRHCFRPGRFRRLTCCHFADNARSARVIEKLGFKATGTCSAYSEARKREIGTVRYERARPLLCLFGVPAA